MSVIDKNYGRMGVWSDVDSDHNTKMKKYYILRDKAMSGNPADQHAFAKQSQILGYKKSAFNWYMKAAEQGYVDSELMVAYCYKVGSGVGIDYVKLIKWLRRAKSKGNPIAQFQLGELYFYGHGDIEKNYSRAFKFYKLSSEQEYYPSYFPLGECYYLGRGVEKDFSEAFKLYRMSSDINDSRGIFRLGLCYEFGIGVVKNVDESFRWYKISSKLGSKDAIYRSLYFCYKWDYFGLLIEDVVEWLEICSNLENHRYDADLILASFYYHGNGVEKDLGKAVELYKRTAENCMYFQKIDFDDVYSLSYYDNI